uniref:EF-hand domain-containing protein n=1 Tax=Dunaliella tertiolecta TaxID=3047 RepID=A0A7S3QKX1_DUNTE
MHMHADLVPTTFREFDADGDGSMSVRELQSAYNKVLGTNFSPQEIRQQVAPTLDFDGSERVSTEEWLRSMSLEHPVDDQWMEVVDENGDGYVSFRELRAAIGDLGGGDAADIIERVAYKQADSRPRDGRLSREEAQNVMDLISAGMQDGVRASMQRRLAQQ